MSKHSAVDIALVIAQFVLAASLALSCQPSSSVSIFGLLSAVGIAIGLWAMWTIGPWRVSVMPDVATGARLITTGPYRMVRHPMYSALLLFGAGLVFMPFRGWKMGVWFALLLVLTAKSKVEERELQACFETYRDYAQRTWRFLPFLW